MVLDGQFEVEFPTPSIDTNLVEKAKNFSQADIAAALGIPAAVVGFLVGMEHQDARAAHESMLRQAYVSCLCPMQRDHAQDYDRVSRRARHHTGGGGAGLSWGRDRSGHFVFIDAILQGASRRAISPLHDI